ncbi:MAG: signal peptidase I [Pseudomonadota bacterium]
MSSDTSPDGAHKPGADQTSQGRKSIVEWVKHEVRELAATIAVFLPIWLVFTTFAYELRSIPSESMVPALQVGDRVAVSKFAYGYTRNSIPFGIGRLLLGDDKSDPNERLFGRAPKRGDVVVFKHPNADKVMIKRLVGLPGDTLQMRGGRLFVNGAEVGREQVRTVAYAPHGSRFTRNAVEYRETLPDGSNYLIHEFGDSNDHDRTPIFRVPDGHVFMMGDNRDNSEDSRAPSGHPDLAAAYPHGWNNGPARVGQPTGLGYVPLDHLIGRAETVLFSLYRCRRAEGQECAQPRMWRGL